MLGFMITWTTYGTWLQGDERGYVKNGQIRPGNEALKKANKVLQSQDMVRLSKAQQEVVQTAIMKQAQLRDHHIYALAVRSNHIHIVLEYTPEPISRIVAYYKNAASRSKPWVIAGSFGQKDTIKDFVSIKKLWNKERNTWSVIRTFSPRFDRGFLTKD